MRAFPVDLPSGVRYWTVVDDELCVVPVADQWLRFLRFGRSRTELTTRSYASGVAFYFRWCRATGRRWEEAAADMGLFMVWLRYSPSRLGAENPTVVWGPGTKPVRGEWRVNGVLAAVRGLLSYAVSVGAAPRSVLGQLYELADSRDLPEEAKGRLTSEKHLAPSTIRSDVEQQPVQRAADGLRRSPLTHVW